MRFDENYPYWELIAEKSYLLSNERLRHRGIHEFEESEAEKSIYVFGCNEAAKAFIGQNREDYCIRGALDNSLGIWKSDFQGVPVLSPQESIPELNPDRDVIIIALKKSADCVADQITSLGFVNFYSLAVMLSQTPPYFEWISEMEKAEKEPLKDLILFESTNDFDGNSGALYEYLKTNNTSHKCAWVVRSVENKQLVFDEDDEAVCPGASYDDLKRYIELRACSKWQIWDNNPIRKVREGQINIFLQHFGMGFKQTSSFYQTPEYVDYILSPNEYVRDQQQSSLLYPQSASFIYGELPRNDVLHKTWHELSKLTDKTFSRTVIWMPTLRLLDTNGRKDADIEYPYGISLVYSEEEMIYLNCILKRLDILLIIRPHPRQMLNYSTENYSNIIYVSGKMNKEVDGYKLLTQMDAMITDYSSVVFDYMLLDRPVAFVLEDLEHFNLEYKMDDPDYFMPGNKIYDMDDMESFLQSLKEGADPFGDKRRALCKIVNPPFEGQGAKKLAYALGLI